MLKLEGVVVKRPAGWGGELLDDPILCSQAITLPQALVQRAKRPRMSRSSVGTKELVEGGSVQDAAIKRPASEGKRRSPSAKKVTLSEGTGRSKTSPAAKTPSQGAAESGPKATGPKQWKILECLHSHAQAAEQRPKPTPLVLTVGEVLQLANSSAPPTAFPPLEATVTSRVEQKEALIVHVHDNTGSLSVRFTGPSFKIFGSSLALFPQNRVHLEGYKLTKVGNPQSPASELELVYSSLGESVRVSLCTDQKSLHPARIAKKCPFSAKEPVDVEAIILVH